MNLGTVHIVRRRQQGWRPHAALNHPPPGKAEAVAPAMADAPLLPAMSKAAPPGSVGRLEAALRSEMGTASTRPEPHTELHKGLPSEPVVHVEPGGHIQACVPRQ